MKTNEVINELKNVFQLDNFNFSFSCAMHLAGDGKKELRRDIIKQLTNEVNPLSKCGLYAVESALSAHFTQIQLF